MPETNPLLAAVDLHKRYGARRAIDGVSLAVQAGEIVGLLGPNGAGKTTMLSILATILAPDAGHVAVAGVALEVGGTSPAAIGLVPQRLALYPRLTAFQNVWHFARMLGLGRREARQACPRALANVGLLDRAHDLADSLSGGMQRRLNLACGVVHDPRVLLLDEPTVGVDLESRERLLAEVRRARDGGAAVIYSTHYMEEAERICDRVCLIDGGRLLAQGTVEELILRAGRRTRVDLIYRGPLAAGWDRELGARDIRVLANGHGSGRLSLEIPNLAEIEGVLDRVRNAGAHVLDFDLHSTNLTDAFVALTGRTLHEPANG
jgi:linearmycin/streptolysin S transport system ATP-binding protein